MMALYILIALGGVGVIYSLVLASYALSAVFALIIILAAIFIYKKLEFYFRLFL